jgi:hypothetical protein
VTDSENGPTAIIFSSIVFLMLAGFFFVLAAANFAAGWGLWQQREWGRITTIVLAVIRLFNFPFGTIIGGLMIWFLLQPNVRAEFAQPAPATAELQNPA